MSATAENGPSAFDTVKLVFAVALFGAGVFAYHYFQDQSTLYRALGIVVVGAVSVAIALTTAQGRATWAFARESRQELRKVIWPNRQETLQTTAIVIVMVFVVAVILWVLDLLFQWGVEKLIIPGS